MSVILITEGASESAGKVVAEARVDAQGKLKIVTTPRDADLDARIATAVRVHKDLAQSAFRSPLGTVYGWDGFWGAAFALRLAMPTIGLSVDWGRLEGPNADEGVEDLFVEEGPEEPVEPIEWLEEGEDNTATV